MKKFKRKISLIWKNTTYFLSHADRVCVCVRVQVCVFICRKKIMREEEERAINCILEKALEVQ